MTKNLLYVAVLAVLFARPAVADVWDIQGTNDDTAVGTKNELVHGTTQTHDLGVRPGSLPDTDWYRLPQKPRASYELIIDGVSGDLPAQFTPLLVERLATDGTTLLQSASVAMAGSNGYSRALRWVNTTSTVANSGVVIQFIKVSGGACGSSCGSDDQYTLRMRETTVNVPRFNTAGGQTTVVLTQNTTERPVNATFFYRIAAGALLLENSVVIAPGALNVVNVASFPALVGGSGSISVAHDGGYGGLAIKAVALEPSTGFSFDTPGVYVPY